MEKAQDLQLLLSATASALVDSVNCAFRRPENTLFVSALSMCRHFSCHCFLTIDCNKDPHMIYTILGILSDLEMIRSVCEFT